MNDEIFNNGDYEVIINTKERMKYIKERLEKNKVKRDKIAKDASGIYILIKGGA